MNMAVYTKIEADPTIEMAAKRDAIAACDGCTAELGRLDDKSVENRFDEFSWTKLHLGQPLTGKPNDTYGHVKVFEDWGDRLQIITRDPIDLVKKNLRILSGLAPAATKQQVTLAENWAKRQLLGAGHSSKPVSLTGTVCFIFLPDSGVTVEDMFINNPQPLPCRLGLPSFWDDMWGSAPPFGTKLEYIGYILIGKAMRNIRSVTVFHPGYRSVRDLWKPGGKTEPHPNGPQDHVVLGGLSELVCDQVLATAAQKEIYGFEVRY
ncbi:hypothetical protein [Loktanella sp. M215]|uniref:hypothetical protein n=1 Tax=Loktanella sp. M215 TaxID=2675431 RepID=UPI001F342626|nr:hypothetical protein [Loktanella sp. M215]MCF7698908.1 hypothetical protein [Loktanella sp. M215]